MTNKQIIEGKECRYWFRLNPGDYRKCSLRGKNDNCDEIKDCFVKELLGKLALKEQECEKLKETLTEIKEIAKEQVKRSPDGETFARPEIKQILQKISECEANQ